VVDEGGRHYYVGTKVTSPINLFSNTRHNNVLLVNEFQVYSW
jgi:hypothetical protein